MAELSQQAGTTPEQALADTAPPACRFRDERQVPARHREILFRGLIVLVCVLTVTTVIMAGLMLSTRKQIHELSDFQSGSRQINCQNWVALHQGWPLIAQCDPTMLLPSSPSGGNP